MNVRRAELKDPVIEVSEPLSKREYIALIVFSEMMQARRGPSNDRGVGLNTKECMEAAVNHTNYLLNNINAGVG